MVPAVILAQASWTHTPSLLNTACAFGAHYLCHRCCSLCTLRMLRSFTRLVCSWRALLVTPMMQFEHSLHASSLYSTRVLLARTTRTVDDAACATSERLGSLLDLSFLPGTNCPADATAYAVSERLGLLFDPGFLPGTNCPPMLQLVQSTNASDLYSTQVPWQAQTVHRCYSLYSLRTLRAFTRPGFRGKHKLSRRCYSLCNDDSTHDVPSSTIL